MTPDTGFRSFFPILGISLVALLAGSCGFCVVLSGVLGVLGGPIAAIFGIFMLPWAIVLVTAFWAACRPWTWGRLADLVFVLGGGLIGCGSMLLLRVEAGEGELRKAFLIGGAVAGVVSCPLILLAKRAYIPAPCTRRPCAAPSPADASAPPSPAASPPAVGRQDPGGP